MNFPSRKVIWIWIPKRLSLELRAINSKFIYSKLECVYKPEKTRDLSEILLTN